MFHVYLICSQWSIHNKIETWKIVIHINLWPLFWRYYVHKAHVKSKVFFQWKFKKYIFHVLFANKKFYKRENYTQIQVSRSSFHKDNFIIRTSKIVWSRAKTFFYVKKISSHVVNVKTHIVMSKKQCNFFFFFDLKYSFFHFTLTLWPCRTWNVEKIRFFVNFFPHIKIFITTELTCPSFDSWKTTYIYNSGTLDIVNSRVKQFPFR